MRPDSRWMTVMMLALVACGGDDDPVEPTPMDPPFSGTIFIDPDIITASDPTTYEGLTYVGQESRTMYDRRIEGWETVDAYVFAVTFDDGLTTEVQVNPEFGGVDEARAEAETYAEAVGRIPTVLRSRMETMSIQGGTEPFGGGNDGLLIHVGQADLYVADGILEETLVHEASHTSLDPTIASAGGWVAAQNADPTFISTYARDNPTREDVAESFLTWLAVRHRADRISASLKGEIEAAIPHRLGYFDGRGFDLHPVQ